MSIDLNSAMQMLENSFGENISSVSIPSMKKEVYFKPLTVGMQKSVSKMTLDSESDVDYQLLKLSVLKTLCIDDTLIFDLLTEVDFISMLAQLRVNNFTENLQLTIPCTNKKCLKRFQHNIDLEKIIKKCGEYKFETCEIENIQKIKGEDVKFKFVLGESTISDNIDYIQYIQYLSEEKSSKIVNINNAKLLTYPIKFIKDVFIGGQQVTKTYETSNEKGEIIESNTVGFNEFAPVDKLKFIDQLPPPLFSEGKNNVLSMVLKKYPHTRLSSLFDKVKCPYCKKTREGVLTNDSFFII